MGESLPPAQKESTIRDLFPDFDEAQLREAEGRVRDYLAFTVRMYDRIRSDLEAYARFKILTAERHRCSMDNEGST